MDFMGSCRHSAPRTTLTLREPCHQAAPAMWGLPSRTACSPRPWARLALTFSTEPSRLTRALQCMICLPVPQASLGSLFAAGLKTLRSCRSVLWTAVLASSPLSILKAKSPPSLQYHRHPESSVPCHLLFSCFHRLQEKDVEQINRTYQVTGVSLEGRARWSELGFAGMFAAAPFSLCVCR